MKTKILSILALLLMTVTQGAWAQNYLYLEVSGTSATLKYGDKGSNPYHIDRGWSSNDFTSTVTTITVDASCNSHSETSFKYLFYNCTKLTTINGLGNLKTAGVTDMSDMFCYDEALTTLDLSTWNTASVTDMSSMFNSCPKLATIYVGGGWSTANVTSSTQMFYNCTSLPGFNSSYIDKTKAHTGDGGYLTAPAPQGSWNYDYTGAVQSFTAPYEGTYTLEAWGAQGGNWVKTGRSTGVGGRGGYASGTVTLAKNQTIYIYVGGQGATTENQQSGGAGGWNGGGNGGNSVSSEGNYVGAGGGGGASHVSLSNAQVIGTNVNTLSGTNYLIVAGGGGGAVTWTATAGAGGGTEGGAGATTGGTSLSPWYNSTLSTGRNGYNAVDYSSYSAEGTGGGGGGYLGGNAGTVTSGTSNQDCGGCGGSSNYNSTYVSNFTTTSDVREGAGKVTITFLSGEGTEDSPYLIASTTDWNNLVSAVNAGEAYSGTYFKMTANVGTVSTWMTGTFSGTFDGDGNTLTVGYSNTTTDVKCAPFGTLNGATIQNLKVAGSISSNQRFIAGIAAWCSSTGNNVTNCLVSATINSSYSGNAADGGLVSLVDDGASLNVTGCAFAGKLLTTNGTTSCGGIVGWRRSSGTATLTNCLYAPASATGSETWIESAEGENGNANFCRWNSSEPTITNCYYTTDFGSGDYTAQGLQARSIAKGDYVNSLAISGDATATYAVSGITVYSGGIDFNDGSTTTFYGGSGQTVSLALTAATRSGYQFKQYAASQGTLSAQTTTSATLTMPAASGETLYTSYTATAGTTGYHGETDDYTKLVDNIKTEAANKWMGTFTPGVYAEFNTPTAIVPTGYIITTGGDAASDAWDARSPKTWKLYGKLHEGDSWTMLDDVTNGNLPKANLTDVSYSIANTAAYKYFRYEISTIKGGTELFQLAELQLKGYDAVVISAEYDPTYTATFASSNDNDGWTISPTQQIEGGTVTVSYTGENKVKSVTVAPKGALTGKFSVSSTKQVQFSKGNLQYVGTWQFAANQYDIFGASQSDDHRDLFGWGTKTNPNNTSTTNGDYSWAEWGENTITNGCTGWRTLSSTEWNYLITGRTNAVNLRTFATVNNVEGLIVMPDGWTASGVTLTITTANYTTNDLSTSQWATLEKQGCVFLPAAGGRIGTNLYNVGTIGDYWSSDESGDTNAYDLNFSINHLIPQNTVGLRYFGWSVRLVRDVAVKANPSTLAGLKAAINDASDLTDLNTKVLGKYVTATGDIQSSSEGAVGIIAYISKTAVDNSFADSRIFVIATENASNSAAQAPSNDAETTYNSTSDLNGYAVTNAWQALNGYNASKAGWNYSASRPDGASHWFVPSYGQWMLGGWTDSNNGNNRPCPLMRSTMQGEGQFYAVSTAINTEGNNTGYCVDGSWWGMGTIQRTHTIRVRAAFVY